MKNKTRRTGGGVTGLITTSGGHKPLKARVSNQTENTHRTSSTKVDEEMMRCCVRAEGVIFT